MDIPIGLIIIAILFLAIALAYLVGIAVPQKHSERYVNELAAQSDMLRNVKTVVIGNVAIVPSFNEQGGFFWDKKIVEIQGAAQPTQAPDYTVHDDAVALIDATMTHVNAKRKPGQLMTADECQLYSVLGGDRDRRQAAVKYLASYYSVETESGKGTGNGVFYRANGGDLSRLMLDMAIKGSRPYPAQVPPSAA